MAEMYYSFSPYSFLGNSPMFFTDPTGMNLDPPQDFNGDSWTDSTETYTKTDNYTYTQVDTDGNTFEGYRTDVVQLETAEVTGSVDNTTTSDSLDPSTIGNNLFGSSYIGPNNPLTRNGDPSYEFVPSFLPEFPAIGHDRRYDNLEVNGLTGLLFDTRAIGADAVFVAEELAISSNPLVSTPERIVAGLSAAGLGAAALPKTIFKLTASGSAQGMTDIMRGYKTSNQGVTNKPGK